MSTHTYTRFQIEGYLDHIAFPWDRHSPPTPEEVTSEAGLDYLSALQKHHLASVPFENISIHYSQDRTLSLNNEDLYDKIVRRKRGGYCMENNQFFGTVLKSLGYEVVSVGARVFGSDGNAGGWDHQISLVVIDGTIYLVDVGFGGRCPTRPIPLIEGYISPWGSTPANHRIILETPSNPILQGLWVLQHRFSESNDWKALYSFGLIEFHPLDFAVMSYATSTRKESVFTQKIIVAKFLLDENGDDVCGMISLQGAKFKRRIGSGTPKLRICANERERVEELREWFGIDLNEEETRGIKGTVTELKECSMEK